MTTFVTPGIISANPTPSNTPLSYQPSLGQRRVDWLLPAGVAALNTMGYANSTTGTATARTPAATNTFTSLRRVAAVSAATAGAIGGFRNNLLTRWRGNAAGLGGFYASWTFGISDAALVSGAISFSGLYGTASHPGPTVQPSALLNVVGFGHLSTDTSFSIFHNDNTGAATQVNLGANFPCNTNNTDMYKIELIAGPNDTKIKYIVTRIGTSFVATGDITTDLPQNNVFLGFQMYRSNNATAAAVGFDTCGYYSESDY